MRMKTKEELNELKKEVEALNRKLAELSAEELEQVKGGSAASIYYFIEIGDEFRAQRFFQNEINNLTDSEKKKIRRAFYDKFGHEID